MNRPRSSIVTEGDQRAPQRAFFRAMGLTDEEIHRPWVGVASTWNEATPCNLTLDRQAKAGESTQTALPFHANVRGGKYYH